MSSFLIFFNKQRLRRELEESDSDSSEEEEEWFPIPGDIGEQLARIRRFDAQVKLRRRQIVEEKVRKHNLYECLYWSV